MKEKKANNKMNSSVNITSEVQASEGTQQTSHRLPGQFKYFLLVVLVLVISLNFAGAATYNSTTGGGNWTAGGTWVGGNAPPNWVDHTANIYGDINANVATLAQFTLITLNDGRSFVRGTPSTFESLTMQNVTFSVVNGNIIVYGNLTLTNSTLTITSGNITVIGALTLSNGSTVNFNSTGSMTLGSFTTSGSGGTLNMNSGTLSVAGTLAINSGSTVNIGAAATATAGGFSNSNNSNAVLSNSGSFTVNGNSTFGGVINNNGSMQLNGNLTSSGSGSSVFTNSGNLNISGNVSIPSSGKFYINPGGFTDVGGDFTVGSNENLIVGTSVAPPPYADLVVRQNLILAGGGDLTVNRNGRLAVLGNVTGAGGDTRLVVNNGGQMYVGGNIQFSGGGSQITNNNSTNPWGLYVGGTVTNSGGGSSTTGNTGDEQVMHDTNFPFYQWVESLTAPLPVTLSYFKATPTPEGIRMEWGTMFEQNFDKFEIERSTSGIHYETIGEVKGGGNSNGLVQYSFVDQYPFTGRNYYRLKMIDLDYSFEFSKVVLAFAEASKDVSVYPNPSSGDVVNLRMNFAPQENDRVMVYDAMGIELISLNANQITNRLEFENTLKPGTYILKYFSEGFEKAVRVVVR